MPQTKQRRPISPFDARSVMLFAALTMGGGLAQAQTSPAQAAQSRYQSGSNRTAPESNATAESDGKTARIGVARNSAGRQT